MAITLDGSLGITSPLETVTGQFSSASTMGFKNRIINGAMVIDQRNAGASVAVTYSNPYTVDRWQSIVSLLASKFTAQQNAGSVTPPIGFSNYLGCTSSSAYSVLTSDYFTIQQKIEGFNTSDLAWGTANAKTVTLSFQVYSSLIGTFGGAFGNSINTRAYPFTYSIPVANTWTTISITIAGDTSGTWVGATNGVGIKLTISLGMGATYSATAGAWATGEYYSATGATSVVGTSGATFYITGVQLEKGSTATSFDYRPYGTELSLCQRYFQKIGGGLNGSPAYTVFSILTYEASNTAWGTVPLKVTMRTQPTNAYSGTYTTNYGTQGTLISDTNQTGPDNGVVGWTTGSSGTTGYSTYLRASNSTAAFISFSAEL